MPVLVVDSHHAGRLHHANVSTGRRGISVVDRQRDARAPVPDAVFRVIGDPARPGFRIHDAYWAPLSPFGGERNLAVGWVDDERGAFRPDDARAAPGERVVVCAF